MTVQSPHKVNIRRHAKIAGRRSGAGFFDRLVAGVESIAATVWPYVMKVLGPVGRFLQRPVRIKGREWNPVRLDATYWGRRDPRMRYGMTWSFGVQALVIILTAIWTLLYLPSCEEYLLPDGGGKNAVMAQPVQVKKVKKKKQIINPNNPLSYDVPDIDKMVEQKMEVVTQWTAHTYAVGTLGSGQGDSAGYSVGDKLGQVRFIRVNHGGEGWDTNMGKGADNNMLLEYGVRSGQKTAKETESRTIMQLDGFVKYRSPPFVYMTGTKDIKAGSREVAALRRYMLDKHGMIFADAAAPEFGKKFRELMGQALPEVKAVPIPLDDELFRPYLLGKVPYAAPHDPPMVMTGWKVGGRWVAVYHPGDIGDCWKDGHSGVSNETAEASYQLGVNIMHYAFSRYSEWVRANKGEKQ